MSKKAAFIGVFGAATMLMAGQGVASANMTWCISDPPIQVVTPAGNHLTVNNMVYLSPSESRFAGKITESATAAPGGAGGTLVTVEIYVPPGVSQAHVVSSIHRFYVSSQADGTGGTVITLYLDVPIA